MASISRSLACVLLAALSLSFVTCDHQEWRPLVPGGKGSLIVVLKADLTQQEVNRFLAKELQIDAANGGKWLRPGIDAIAKTSVDGHQAYAVSLDPAAAPEERESVRKAVENSSYVYRVFQNVALEDIKLSEGASTEGERPQAEQSREPK
jgi:hypothetical protein